MNDERKTKAQLIEELETERQKSAGGVASSVERQLAAERVRAEAMAMKESDDLLKVVAVLSQQMTNLGMDSRQIAIVLIDEERDQKINYSAMGNPAKSGHSWSSPSWVEYDENTIVGILLQSSLKEMDETTRCMVESWRNREVRIREWKADKVQVSNVLKNTGIAVDEGYIDSFVAWTEGKHVVNVPFVYGWISFIQQGRNNEHESIVRELGQALSLGYIRFLDFQRLEEQNVQIQEATHRKSDFLARMSHDLRSPMNAIIGYTRLLRRRAADRLDEREQRNLANIETSSGNLLNLINDILDLSRIEAGRIEVDAQPVDVRTLADECADALESIVKEDVELRRELEDMSEIQTDPGRLRQVVMNLLGNATKFTDSGSITVSLRIVDGDAELSVADTGVGIPADDLPHIFDEFRQVERQGGEQTEGTGLGLAIAKKTVVLLGGTLTAESEVGVGTTFTVRIGDYPEPMT
jgi:signal transduction histidine kinase